MTSRRTIERIARSAHEVNRAYCKELGEEAQGEWSMIRSEEREAIRQAVCGILNGTWVSLQDQHEAWRQRRIDDGWTWGPEKSIAEKRSPALLPFHDLPEAQRLKGAIFRAVCLEAQRLLMEPES